MSERPNIVLICADQWRGDCLSIAGHPAVETPHLDHLAHEGVRFTNAYTGVASCIAARAGLYTGLTHRTHGRVGYQDGVTWNYPVTMAGELAKAGYQTISVGKMHVHPQRHAMGFEKVVLHDGMLHHYRAARQSDYEDWLGKTLGPDCGLYDHGLESNSWVARPWHLPEHTHPTYWAVSRAVEFLRDRDKDRPFFLYLSFVAPHPPLAPPKCYFDQYLSQDLPAPPVGDWVDKLELDFDEGRWNSSTSHARLDPRAQHRAQAGYYGLITQIDHQIGRLLEHCHDEGVRRNTVFAFTADHGEMLGDHHLFRKVLPYAGSIRIPMLLNFPASMGITGGQAPGQLAELRDVMPTLLEAAGADVPECVEGMSLLPLLRGDSVQWRGHLHGEHSSGELSNHYIVDGRFKYVWYSRTGMEQLFDTVNDPQDLHDLIDDPKCRKTVDRLRGLLIAELAGREEGYSDGKQLFVGKEPKRVLSHVAKV